MRLFTVLPALLFAAALVPAAEIAHLHKIDDHLFTANQPKSEDFATLKQMGIKTVVDLRGGWIHAPRERKEVEAAGMKYVSVRLSGFWEPHDSQIAKILSVVEDPAQQPVFVHCRRGDDRTGIVIACYHIDHDHWTNQRALDAARHDGMSILEVLMQRYVRHFDPVRVHTAKAQP